MLVCVTIYYSLADVSGGFSSSILDAIRHTMQTSNALHMKAEETGKEYTTITLDEALYMATLGGAQGIKTGY